MVVKSQIRRRDGAGEEDEDIIDQCTDSEQRITGTRLVAGVSRLLHTIHGQKRRTKNDR